MKITPKTLEIPFSDKQFVVEMSGLELIVIKMLTGIVTGNPLRTLRKIANDIFYSGTSVKYPSLNKTIQFDEISLSDFIEKINDMNK